MRKRGASHSPVRKSKRIKGKRQSSDGEQSQEEDDAMQVDTPMAGEGMEMGGEPLDMEGYEYKVIEGRDEKLFGTIWRKKEGKHSKVESGLVGTIWVIVADMRRKAMLELHQRWFHEGIPSRKDYVFWRSKYAGGGNVEKDDILKTWAMSKPEYPEEMIGRMDGVRDRMYGPVEEQFDGPEGLAIERL
ncbi:hypothetical protein EV361DRAFT_1038007, partial [Lentinula raphanica]